MSVLPGRLAVMARSSVAALLGERIARHGLATRRAESAPAAALLTTAIQAQEPLASRLGLRARSSGVSDGDVLRAIETERSVVRTWLMRGTIHLVASSDLRWMVRLIGPVVARKFQTRRRQLGLTDQVLGRALAALPELLADGPHTRAEIREGLAVRAVTIDSPDPSAYWHLLLYASTLGLVCRGPDRGRNATFALVDDWLPNAPAGPSGDDALAELARRYFAAYSPATAADFGVWSALPTARAVALIRDELTPADVDGRPGFRLGDVAPQRGVRLLPAFDNYLLGYKDRTAILEPELHMHVYQGGWILPTVLVDGRVVGTWALERAKGKVRISPFAPLKSRVRAQVDAEISDLGRFLGRDIDAVVEL
jgi:Winged helix DNA-binding domain